MHTIPAAMPGKGGAVVSFYMMITLLFQSLHKRFSKYCCTVAEPIHLLAQPPRLHHNADQVEASSR
jgi:hypothetical protein